MDRFHDVVDDLVVATGRGIVDHVGKLGEILGGYTGGRTLATEEGSVDFSTAAAKQLFGKIGLDVPTMNKFNEHPEIQQAMVRAKLEDSGEADTRLVARGVRQDDGLFYHAFLTRDHLPVLNSQIITGLRNTLPETAMVHAAHISNRKMSLRVVDDNWYHDLGSGGRALTAIVIDNDERGKGGLSIRTGVTRVACWNYTLDHQPVFAHSSGFLAPNRLEEEIGTAIERLHGVAEAVSNRLLEFHDVGVDDVQNMLRLMSGEMGLPNYATEAAERWWEEAGSINTVFWVVQALAFAAGEMTKRKNTQWTRRATVEYQTYHMADDYVETNVLSLHECPRCHRPMNVLDDEDTVEGEYTIGEDTTGE